MSSIIESTTIPQTKQKCKFIYKDTLNQLTSPQMHIALLNENYESLHTPIVCKDYINDVLWILQQPKGTKGSCYGMNLTHDDNLAVLNTMPIIKLGVMFNKTHEVTPNDICIDGIKRSLRLIYLFEQGLGFNETTTTDIECEGFEDKPSICLNIDKRWFKSPMLSSLYLLLLRCGRMYNDQNVFEYFDTLTKTTTPPWYYKTDIFNINRYYYHFQQIFDGKLIEPELSPSGNMMSAHNKGYKFYIKQQ